MHRGLLLITSLSLFFAISCSPSKPEVSDPPAETENETQTESGEETTQTDSGPQKTDPVAEPSSPKRTVKEVGPDGTCHAAGELKKGRCICGDGSVAPADASNWVCANKRLECMDPYKGCKWNGVIYPAYSTVRKNAVMCGHAGPLKDLKGYGCDPEYGGFRSEIRGAWRCDSAGCDCHGETVPKGTYCTARGILCHGDCPEGYLTGSALKDGIYTCDGVPLSKDAADSASGIVCLNKKWTCENGYVCEKNAWKCVADPAEYADNPVCDGVTLKTIADEKSAAFYACRYGRWICENPSGCSCNTGGRRTEKIALGEACVHPECESAEKPPFAGGMYSKDRFEHKYKEENWTWLDDGGEKGVCLEGGCKCGKGFTPQFGRCVNGVSRCGNLISGDYGEFYCAMYYHRNEGGYVDYRGNLDVLSGDRELTDPLPFVSEFRSGEKGGMLICGKKEGCRTPDGRHYPLGAVIGHHGWNDPYLTTAGLTDRFDFLKSFADNQQYHLHGTTDTTVESVSVLGDCVIDVPEDRCEAWMAGKARMPVCHPMMDDGRPGYIGRPGDLPNNSEEPRCAYARTNTPFGLVTAYPQGLGNTQFEYRAPAMVYDVAKCEGGTRWCHGKNHAPVRVPEKAEGYECRNVEKIPGVKGKKGLKSWVCTSPDGCECGGQTCEIHHACTDGQCHEGEPEQVEKCAGEPLLPGYRCDRNWLGYAANGYAELGQVCTEERCSCGDIICPEGATCAHGRCLCGQDVKPGGNYRCESSKWRSCQDNEGHAPRIGGWYCDILAGCECGGKHIEKNEPCSIACYGGSIQKDGCYCGTERMPSDGAAEYACARVNGSPVIVCADPHGCACGDETCPSSIACIHDQCIDPLTDNPITPNPESDALSLTPACRAANGCACGESTCRRGEFCMNGECQESVWATIADDKRVFYDFINILRAVEAPQYRKVEQFYEFCDAHLPKNWNIDPQNPDFERIAWHEILLNPKPSSTPSGYAVTPHFEHYYCGFNETVFKADQVRCALDSGCSCGKSKCPRGAECIHGKCVYDEVYNDAICGGQPPLKSEILNATSVDKSGRCVCRGMPLSPSLVDALDTKLKRNRSHVLSDLYLCTEFGWVCRSDLGCPCGQETCQLGAVCGTNGYCSAVISTCINDGEGGCILN